MSIAEELDLTIKKKKTGIPESNLKKQGYQITYKGEQLTKPTYTTNAEWDAFLKAMPEMAKVEYGKGGGDELHEKSGHPPKMACYGSSSRMIFEYSNHKKGFHYEKKLHTTIGGTANLDGFFADENRNVFVEAKCHEPYSIHKYVISTCYAGVYKHINAQMDGKVRIELPSDDELKNMCNMPVTYWAGDEKLERLDMKQMICHLLGIASGLLRGEVEKKKIEFLYFLYDPTGLDIPGKAKSKILAIYEKTCKEAAQVDFVKLFEVILQFLREKPKYRNAMTDEEADQLVREFSFTLCSQKNYKSLIN